MHEKIAVLGLGHVGLAVAVGLARLGHRVVGYDTDSRRVAALQAGDPALFEQGMAEALAQELSSGRLAFAETLLPAVRDAGIVFVCVGTPPGTALEPDISQVMAAVDSVAACPTMPGTILALKSTVPPGTGRRVQTRLKELGAGHVHVAVTPEFLREGTALDDFLHPARIVVGADSPAAIARLRSLYAVWSAPLVSTDLTSAEIIKYGSNAFLALRVSFINLLADLCDRAGGQIDDVAAALGLDPRIGSAYLRAGAGYGGSCLPKDLSGLIHAVESHGIPAGLLRAVEDINAKRPKEILDLLERHVPRLAGARIAVLGLSFKPGTDDVRDAPSQRVVGALLQRGAQLRLHDPHAAPAFAALYPAEPPMLDYAPDAESCLVDANGAILLTDWAEYHSLDLTHVVRCMRQPVLIDARNVFSPVEAAQAGLRYESFGRGGGGDI